MLVGVTLDATPPLDVYVTWLADAAQRVLRYETPEGDEQLRLF